MKITTTTTHKKQNLIAYMLLFALVVLAVRNVSAQKEATNWYFGNKAGLNLENVTYTMGDGALVSNSTCATIATPEGDLRMYTNGVTLWNAKHLIIGGGTGIKGSTAASQGSIIIPVPNSNHMFYVFTAPANGVDMYGNPDSLRYTIVDMSGNEGLGQVDMDHKNVPIYGVVEEKLTAVYTGTDVWIIAHGFKTNKYVAYKLTESGLEGPVESTVGSPDNLGGRGCMKTSPDGKRIARSMSLQNKIELADFDAATGVVSNSVFIGNLPGAYGVDFSSYSSRLYVTTIGVNQNYIQQFNLKLNSPALVEASKYTITPPANNFPTALQLGYNGILYAANSQSNTLSNITNADTLGSALIYNSTAITVPGTIYNGLPAFNQSFFKRVPPPPVVLSVEDDALSSLQVYPNPSNGIFRLAVGKNKSQDIQINVYSMMGTKVYSNENMEEGINTISVDLTKQPAGVYFFDINTPQGKTIKRLVIN
jgi:hypothetical protein